MTTTTDPRRDAVRACGFRVAESLLGAPVRTNGKYSEWSVPWRPDTHPSLHVYHDNGGWEDRGRPGDKGDVFDLVARVRGLDVRKDFREVLTAAEALAGIAGPSPRPTPAATTATTTDTLAAHYGLAWADFTAHGCTVENGAVRYPTARPDGKTGAKFKTLARNAGGKRDCRHTPGGAGFFPASSLTGPGVLVVTGGEEKALAGLAAGLRTVTYTAGEGSLKPEAAAFLVAQGNREFIVAMDADEAGRKGAVRVAEALTQAGAASVRVCAWPEGTPKGHDLNDILRDGGPDGLKRFLDAAQAEGETPAEAAPSEAWGDIKAGRILADRIRGRMLWVCDLGQWFCWDGRRWKADAGDTCIMREAKATALARRNAAPADSSNPETKAAMLGCNMPYIKRAINAAQSEDGAYAHAADLDTDAWRLNVRNGTVNLRTGELRPHDPADLITKLCPVEYDPAAPAPTWERIIREIMCGDAELVHFLHLFLGYCLTGDCREQVFVVAHGAGQNGKGTLTRALGHILGNYCTTMDTSTIMDKARANHGGTREDLVALKGARLILASELNAGQRLDEAGVKSLTGQDPITARPLYGRHIEFEMTGKIFLACNHLPAVRGQDMGIWRRIRLVPFGYTVPPEKRDNDLDAKLLAEAPGILAWLVRGCLEWIRSGRLPDAQAVRRASEEYRQTSDTLGGFLTECVERMPGAKVQAGPLYSAYVSYTEANNERPASAKRLSEMLVERGFTKTKQKGCIHWHGLQLTEHEDPEVEGGRGLKQLSPMYTHERSLYNPLPPSTHPLFDDLANPDDDPAEAAMSAAERDRDLQ